ncbi:T9SS type A sorting domain-containing protein [Aequorivita aurantiaca]|uniref:T9SS type A sorting domain-containing protein n=1 Tax=Aequorivita aurantiaca TaxID=3053356 RepID=UPI0033904DF0
MIGSPVVIAGLFHFNKTILHFSSCLIFLFIDRGQIIYFPDPFPSKVESIDVSSLQAGGYFVKLNTTHGSTYSKFIKE